MRDFIARERRLFVLLFLSALWSISFLLFQGWYASVPQPLDVAIALSPPGRAEAVAQVRFQNKYHLMLEFDGEGAISRERLRELVGSWSYGRDGKPIPSGVRIPIRWALSDKDSRSVASGELDSFGAWSWSGFRGWRHIEWLALEPGTYSFSAEVLRDVPDFGAVRTRITLVQEPKESASRTYVIMVLTYGLSVFLVWPATIWLVLLLVWRWVGDHFSLRSGKK